MLIEIGQEFGSTTGRKRIVNWLNLNKLIDAVKISGVTKLIINKCDILEQINTYKVYQNNSLYKFNTLTAMQSFIKSFINHNASDYIEVVFSGNKESI